jgi:FixJ family two-component response regulator
MGNSDNCVFVVDDDLSARNGFARLLRTAGYDVRTFASAREFLNAIGHEASGCLVLDARRPGLSSKELQAELQVRDVRLPIIVVTAGDDPETRRIAQKIKAVGFFRKPVDGMALLDAVEWAMANSAGGNSET